MAGLTNLETLLKTMQPELSDEEWVFATVPEQEVPDLKFRPLMTYYEKEGATIITSKKNADENALKHDGSWARITLNVHSSLEAVGFTAAITPKLAEARISTNIVSAYYHDHIFVQWETREKAMQVLKKLSENYP